MKIILLITLCLLCIGCNTEIAVVSNGKVGMASYSLHCGDDENSQLCSKCKRKDALRCIPTYCKNGFKIVKETKVDDLGIIQFECL